MSKPKRHHYVPQFALRHFAADAKRLQIWAFDKNTDAVRRQAIRDSAVEGYFYDDERLSKNGVDIELMLADFESKVAPVIDDIVQSKSLYSMGVYERQCVVDYLLVQLFRTRASREFTKQGAIKLGHIFDENAAKQVSFTSLIRDFDMYRRILDNHIVTLRVAHTHERFVLGDSVSLITLSKEEPAHALTTMLPRSTIIVPLSSSCCIMLFPSERVREVAEAEHWYRADIRVLMEAQPTALGDVWNINKLSIIASHRFLFSSSDEFTDVRQVLKTEPNARNGRIGGWVESRQKNER